jgi:hypothetical protein
MAAMLTGCSAAGASSAPPPSTVAAATPTAGARNLVVTNEVRASLVAAGAKAKENLPTSAFRGLEKGRTYYALDLDTRTYWAGAALVPNPDSTAAQISVQDNGSYDIFVRPQSGEWRAYEVGTAGVAGTRCPIHVPREVLRLWGWRAHACRPARS